MVQLELEGKVAIITGAAGGIGQVYSRGLAAAGASVVLADLRGTAAEQGAAELAAQGHAAIGVPVDIADAASVRRMVERTCERFGGVDVLVNNAALMSEMQHLPLADYPLDEWERVMRVNLTGALLCTQAVVPSMRARGGGRIINQSSAGAFGARGAYGVSKLALIGLSVALASELGPLGITVNAIAPGLVADEAGYRSMPKGSAMREAIKAQLPLRRHAEGTPEDLLGALLLLASPAGDWITGQTLHVDGGWILRP